MILKAMKEEVWMGRCLPIIKTEKPEGYQENELNNSKKTSENSWKTLILTGIFKKKSDED
jgi:hypothetical protein